MSVTYQVVEEYDESKHGSIEHPFRIKKCILTFKKGDQFQPKDFLQKHGSIFTKNGTVNKSSQTTLSYAIKFGREKGLLERIETQPITFVDFQNLETISYFANQVRGSKYKNIESHKLASTRKSYLQSLYKFNNWLYGKSFEFSRTRQIDVDTFKKEKELIKLTGLEHLLKLYQESLNAESEFIKIVKMYLMSEEHKKLSSRYMAGKHSAIIAYFEKNDSPIKFKYNPSVNHNTYSEENESATLSLQDLKSILVNGKPNPLEQAVVLCKFHRGLDSSTFADRFNFQVWDQLVAWFGHNDYENWDLEKCPVPIRLTRVKTDYTHTGFLERDSIISIQQYLNYRYDKYTSKCRVMKLDEGYVKAKNEIMRKGEPLFVLKGNLPLTVNWVTRLIPRLAKRAGIQKIIESNSVKTKHEKTGHELRDLLKSTLIACDVADYVCELAIGHKVGDSYEKQDKLYPSKSRSEYAKASSKLNIISKIQSSISEDYSNIADLQEQIAKIEEKTNKKKDMDHDVIVELVKELQEMRSNYVDLKLEFYNLKNNLKSEK
ncbi:MAG: hypothetical protein K5793_03725 [Nitrosarchaeum sp.]|nr:hypothetical protein [Nitrosarchaeum sp.]